MQNGRYCFFCRRENVPLEIHHCINGNPGRKLSDKYGLTVYLCTACHRVVHAHIEMRLTLKQMAQAELMKKEGWSVDDFRRIFGKNYL